jgi:hypothetical protein
MTRYGAFVGRVCNEEGIEWVGLTIHGGGATLYMNEESARTLADQLLLVANQMWPVEDKND